MSLMPRWLADHLETEQGAEPGARYAKARRCKCAAMTLQGLDADVAALHVTVDPEPLNIEGELAALLTTRRTYTLRPVNTSSGKIRHELTHRPSWRITGTPPRIGAPYDVLVSHRCGAPMGAFGQQPSNLT